MERHISRQVITQLLNIASAITSVRYKSVGCRMSAIERFDCICLSEATCYKYHKNVIVYKQKKTSRKEREVKEWRLPFVFSNNLPTMFRILSMTENSNNVTQFLRQDSSFCSTEARNDFVPEDMKLFQCWKVGTEW